MRVVIAALILLAIASFAGAFWMAFNGKGPHFEEAPVEAEAIPKPEPEPKVGDASPAAPAPLRPRPPCADAP